MKLRGAAGALETAEKIAANTHVLVEQIRMSSPEDRDSYIVIVRLADGNIHQVDDPSDWPLPKPERPFEPSPRGEPVSVEETPRG